MVTEPCPRCGGSHEGDCPASASTPEQADDVCPFCGVAHPREYKCGQWARLIGPAVSAPWQGEGLAALPALPSVQIEHRERKPRANPVDSRWLRIAVVCLALYGAGALAVFVVGHLLGTSGSSVAALPQCSRDAMRRNLVTASTIQSETGQPLYRRIDRTNSLLFSSGAGCSEQLLTLYTTFIEYQALCLAARGPDACANRDNAHASINQAIDDPQY